MTRQSSQRVAQRIEPDSASVDVLGTIMHFLLQPDQNAGTPCVMRWTMSPGIVIPLHSHPDPETIFMISGDAEGLTQTATGFQWSPLAPGDLFDVPGGAKHALRNHWPWPAVMTVVTTARLGQYFLEVGRPVFPTLRPANSPTLAAVRDFLKTATRYGHWIATPEENFRAGIDLPPTWC
jgi:quercetin dioxygenase-like cupin family protein